MNKLYIGNLSSTVTAADIHELFGERKLSIGQVLLKSGYAFVDCPDENAAIKVIETLSGKVELHGKVIEVDYSVPKKQSVSPVRILVSSGVLCAVCQVFVEFILVEIECELMSIPKCE
ncbi:hypothetical protein scyTo_0018358 [Scyliorhinus torazame]|uniref:RRM domain-containing protein n=1 Tax=Scyliorhinus torazame TaxID=75743 RepID=A0A401PU31_SCYTO|nr:hypothetical protein [Scyliorhinus torazame]